MAGARRLQGLARSSRKKPHLKSMLPALDPRLDALCEQKLKQTRTTTQPLPSHSKAESIVSAEWIDSVGTASRQQRAKVVLRNSGTSEIGWFAAPGCTVFRGNIKATHRSVIYKSVFAILNDQTAWGSYCSCPAGEVQLPFQTSGRGGHPVCVILQTVH